MLKYDINVFVYHIKIEFFLSGPYNFNDVEYNGQEIIYIDVTSIFACTCNNIRHT